MTQRPKNAERPSATKTEKEMPVSFLNTGKLFPGGRLSSRGKGWGRGAPAPGAPTMGAWVVKGEHREALQVLGRAGGGGSCAPSGPPSMHRCQEAPEWGPGTLSRGAALQVGSTLTTAGFSACHPRLGHCAVPPRLPSIGSPAAQSEGTLGVGGGRPQLPAF